MCLGWNATLSYFGDFHAELKERASRGLTCPSMGLSVRISMVSGQVTSQSPESIATSLLFSQYNGGEGRAA